MKEVKIQTFEFDELSPFARRKALTDLRECNLDYGWWEHLTEFFVELLAAAGVSASPDDVRFTGFYSQGDGASFSGSYAYQKTAPERLTARLGGEDLKAWLCFADNLENAARPSSYTAEVDITAPSGHYAHAYTMSARATCEKGRADEAEFLETFRKMANWYYQAIEDEFNYLTSEMAITETIAANGWTFLSNGQVFNQEEI